MAMRSTRITRYRKKYKKGIIVLQILFILYAALISISQLTSSTSAFFNHTKAVSISIPTGSWWDGSDLLFIGKGNQNLNDACPPVEFSVEIKNTGYSMIASTNYEVFYIENGNPENGEKISEGTLEPIKAGAVETITHQAEEEGFYTVKAFQQPNYEGETDEVIWSEKIKVKCPEKEKEKQFDKDESLESNEEVLEKTKDPEESNEISEEASQEQKEQESSIEDEEKLDKSAETDSEKEPVKSEQEDKQEILSEPNKETDDKPVEVENKKMKIDTPNESEEQENSQTDQAKEGEQE
ncbi:amyloid fiber anchoring/assembly protein TapA [Gracilibacillus salitolerans]|uniref:Amyloid fiber anchoring/assembly protein TapA n=2 Tax=Gracilibacillus salitolerans TaxID=2663022 RepID=A0A5Q2TIW4_9BACI|nr:amyloid fiber anchoring/assembly protein TapA [Gracilibacillus salitolerans]